MAYLQPIHALPAIPRCMARLAIARRGQTGCRLSGLAAGLVLLAFALPAQPARAEFAPGFYVGAGVGFAAGLDEAQEVNGPRFFQADTRGPTGSVFIGRDWRFGHGVVGLELTLGHLGQTGSTTRAAEGGQVDLESSLGVYGSLTGRAGFLLDETWLVYGRAGLMVAELDGKIQQSCTSVPCGLVPSVSRTHTGSLGFLVGAGVERDLNGPWRLRGEYQYLRTGSELALPANGNPGPGWHHQADAHVVQIGLIRRF